MILIANISNYFIYNNTNYTMIKLFDYVNEINRQNTKQSEAVRLSKES